MTTCIYKKWIWVWADKRVTGNARFSDNHSKIFQVTINWIEYTIANSWFMVHPDILRKGIDAFRNNEDKTKSPIVEFCDYMKQYLQIDNGTSSLIFIIRDSVTEMAYELLFLTKWEYQVCDVQDDFVAIGSWSSIALGILELVTDMDVVFRSVSNIDLYTSPIYDHVSFDTTLINLSDIPF